MDTTEDPYVCVGVCMSDPDSGYCLGCGRPPLPSASTVTVIMEPRSNPDHATGDDPDSPPRP